MQIRYMAAGRMPQQLDGSNCTPVSPALERSCQGAAREEKGVGVKDSMQLQSAKHTMCGAWSHTLNPSSHLGDPRGRKHAHHDDAVHPRHVVE